MTDFTRRFDVVIDAPVHDVFEYCRDPRHLFAGWPQLEVTEVVITPDGVGTTARITGRFLNGLMVERIEREFTEVVPGERIVSRAHATVDFAGRTREVANGPVFTWLFAAEGGGTRLTLVVLEEGLSWWASALESVSAAVMAKTMQGMLSAIRNGVEHGDPSALRPGEGRRPVDLRNLPGELLFRLATAHTDVLTRRFGAATARTIRHEMLQEYRSLVPGLPDLGGRRNPEAMSMVLAPWALALYRVVLRHGGSVEDAGEAIHHAVRSLYGRLPQRVRRSMGRSTTGERARRKARWFAEHRYPGNWVYAFVDGDGQPFDFGLDATQCAIVTYLHAQSADELTPYLCDLDYVVFEALGLGLTRTGTLAWGCDRCDFRVTNPGRTTSTWPPLFVERSCGVPRPVGAGAGASSSGPC